MHVEQDLGQDLERAIGGGPPHVPLEQRIAAGRRALRRRRLATGIGALAAATVLGATATALVPQLQPGSGQVAATDAASHPAYVPPGERLPDGGPELSPTGELTVPDGLEVVERVDDPFGSKPPAASVGLVLEGDGFRMWMLLWATSRGSSSIHAYAEEKLPTFDLWLADQVALQRGEPTLALVQFADGERLVPAEPGVTMLDQQASPPGMPKDWAVPRERVAVAQVEWRGDVWFVMARDGAPEQGGSPLYTPVAASVVGDPATIEEFVTIAREELYPDDDGVSGGSGAP